MFTRITTFLGCFLLVSVLSAQIAPPKDSLLIHFSDDVPEDTISAIKDRLNATSRGMTTHSKIRLWEVPAGTDISAHGTPNDDDIIIQGYSTGQANIMGGYKLPNNYNQSASFPLSQTCDDLLLQSGQSTLGSQSVRIAILDTGIDIAYPESFYAEFLPTNNIGFDFVNNEAIPKDSVGHGNQMGSIIGNILYDANTSNSNIQLLSYKVVDKNGSATRWDMFRAIDAAIDADVDIMNLSLGYRGDSTSNESLMEHALQVAATQGILIVTAAGNDYALIDDDSKPFFPASLDVPNMIVVGASSCKAGDEFLSLACYSNYGDAVDIYVKGKQECQPLGGYSTDPNNNVAQGTSHATAAITAVVAQLKTYNTSNEEVRCALLNSSTLYGDASTSGERIGTDTVSSSTKDGIIGNNGNSDDINSSCTLPNDFQRGKFFLKIGDAIDELSTCQANLNNTTTLASVGTSTPNSTKTLRIVPNPFSESFSIHIPSTQFVDANILLLNQFGQLIHQAKLVLEKGSNTHTIQKINLEAGVYFVHIAYGNEHITKKIVKQ